MAALLVGAIPAAATTITFDGVSQGPLTTYSQGGFTVARTAGDINAGYGSGNPAPSLFGFGSGTFQVTTTGLFTFAGFDGGSGALSRETQMFGIVGYLNNVAQFTTTYIRTGANGFQTFPGSPTFQIDRLVFDLSATNNTSYNVDNIVVNPAAPAVPEPATWGMMILGLGGIGFAMRRRPGVSTRVSFAG